MAASIRALVPSAEVHHFGLHEARSAPTDKIAAEMDTFAKCDFVFLQPSLTHGINGLQEPDFAARCKRIIPYPMIAYRGLQPDCHYIKLETGDLVQGALGPYHSAIVAGAYQAGLCMDRAEKLFNVFTYRALGYFDIRANSEPIGVESLRHQYDYSAFFDGERGVFMHTINHPTIGIIFDSAKQALEKAQVHVNSSATPPDDWLSTMHIWPVYTGLRSYSDAEIRFKSPRVSVDLSLSEFVKKATKPMNLPAPSSRRRRKRSKVSSTSL